MKLVRLNWQICLIFVSVTKTYWWGFLSASVPFFCLIHLSQLPLSSGENWGGAVPGIPGLSSPSCFFRLQMQRFRGNLFLECGQARETREMSRRAQLPGLCCWTKFAQTSSWLSDSSPSPEILEKATSIGCLWFPRVSYFIRSWNYVQEGSCGWRDPQEMEIHFFFGPTYSMRKLPCQGWNPSYSSDNTTPFGSLTC